MIFVPGAGFYGHSGSSDFALDAALMARSTGRPVRSLWQRQDEPLHAPLNPAMKTKMTARLDVNGRIVAYDALVTSSPHSTRPAGLNELNLRAQQFISKPMPMAPATMRSNPKVGRIEMLSRGMQSRPCRSYASDPPMFRIELLRCVALGRLLRRYLGR